MNSSVLRYQAKMLSKRTLAGLASMAPKRRLTRHPSVTVFISSYNTRYALELTLESLRRNTRYPAYSLVVGDNNSTDGSLEYLRRLAEEGRIRLIASPEKLEHSEWLDRMLRECQTEYWCAVDSDIWFLGSDWLLDFVEQMDADPELFLLAAYHRSEIPRSMEPNAGEWICLAESFATCVFIVRTRLRDHISSSFRFTKERSSNPDLDWKAWDTGAKILEEMKRKGLRHAYLPRKARLKFHHFGSLSWAHNDLVTDPVKRYEVSSIKARCESGRW